MLYNYDRKIEEEHADVVVALCYMPCCCLECVFYAVCFVAV